MTEASRVQTLLNDQNAEIDRLKNRVMVLEAALRNVTTAWDTWQKMSDSNSFTELFASICEAKALEGKDD